MRRKRSETEFHIEIAPVNLIDLLLVLLVFFIVTTTFFKFKSIQVVLPDSSSSVKTVLEKDVTVINVDKDGTLYVAGKAMEPEPASERLRTIREANEKAVFQVGADKASRHEDFIKALDTLRRAGIDDFAIQTDSKE